MEGASEYDQLNATVDAYEANTAWEQSADVAEADKSSV